MTGQEFMSVRCVRGRADQKWLGRNGICIRGEVIKYVHVHEDIE